MQKRIRGDGTPLLQCQQHALGKVEPVHVPQGLGAGDGDVVLHVARGLKEGVDKVAHGAAVRGGLKAKGALQQRLGGLGQFFLTGIAILALRDTPAVHAVCGKALCARVKAQGVVIVTALEALAASANVPAGAGANIRLVHIRCDKVGVSWTRPGPNSANQGQQQEEEAQTGMAAPHFSGLPEVGKGKVGVRGGGEGSVGSDERRQSACVQRGRGSTRDVGRW